MSDLDLDPVENAADLASGDAAPEVPQRPEHIPEKFWDPEAGSVRVDALARSYGELERKLGRMVPLPEGGEPGAFDRLLSLLGRPESPDGYEIAASHPLLATDPELNTRLHAAGFTQKQAQLVYELAAERMLPMLQEGVEEIEASREVERLERHFGSAEAWRDCARQIRTWAAANLPEQVRDVLSTSYEGILALHQMMRNAEPSLVAVAGQAGRDPDEQALHEMMRDPRYWRDRDPQLIARVTDGFRRLYPD
jgi:hypothetical protein